MSRIGRMVFLALLASTSPVLAEDAGNYTPLAKRVSAQEGLVAQLVPKGETPRLPDGQVDLNGVWGFEARWDTPYPAFGSRGLEFFEPDQVVLQRGNHWKKPHYKPELWDKVFDTDFSRIIDDPAFHCMPAGNPRLGAPSKIVQTANEVILINSSYGQQIRYIPTDGRPLTDVDADFTNFGGVGSGRWEGDTLVIESVGFTDQTWLQWTGYIHSDRMKLTERITRKGNLLYYSFVVDDPEVLVEPWVSDVFTRRLHPDPKVRFDEASPCVEQDASELGDSRYRG